MAESRQYSDAVLASMQFTALVLLGLIMLATRAPLPSEVSPLSPPFV